MSRPSPSVLALDLGTSSIRAAFFDAHGRMRRESLLQEACTPERPEPGASTFNAAALAERVERLIDQAMHKHGDGEILAVAMSTYWHSLVGLDADGEPLTDLLMWSDLRSSPQAEALRSERDPPAIHQRTGAVLHPTFWPAKLCWLHATQPEVFKKVRAWVSFGDYLHRRWLARSGTSLSMASGTGLLDQRRCVWDAEMLAISGVDEATLPALHDLDAPYEALRPEFAQRWPGLARARWFPAIGDGACSNVGVGCVSAQHWAITVGTSAAVRAVLQHDIGEIPPGLWLYRVDRKRPILGGALNNGGNVLTWLQATLRLPPSAVLNATLASRAWGTHGLEVAPFLAGERSPDWPLSAVASISGLTQVTSPIDIAQAFMEAVASNIAQVSRLLESAVGQPESIVVTGGGLTHMPVWSRMLATALERPVLHASVRESSTRGAALLALEAMGVLKRLPHITNGTSVEPAGASR